MASIHPEDGRGTGVSTRRRRRSIGAGGAEQGFTLLELLVVLAVLALLAGLVAPRVMSYLGGARQDTARLQIDRLATVLDFYRLDVGSYPTTEQGLEALIEAPAGVEGWRGPYLEEKEPPRDPWGNPFVYRAPGKERPFELLSLGADGRPGGEGEDADISNAAR